MKLTVVACSDYGVKSVNDMDVYSDRVKEMSGKMAGICYLSGNYFERIDTEESEKSIKRCNSTIKNGHHSVTEHSYVTVVFEEINKATAMLLNSLNVYVTSEKSARYTKMHGLTNKEDILYDKWKVLLLEKILKEYPDMEKKVAEKLAQENARYFFSIFANTTTMAYTASVRQWCYIRDWCLKYMRDTETKVGNNIKQTWFEKKLLESVMLLENALYNSGICIEGLHDTKDRGFRFYARQVNDAVCDYKECYGDLYVSRSRNTFAYVAQAQRHRTTKVFIDFKGNTEGFYVPDILGDSERLTKLWLEDMKSVEEYIPQGTLVTVIETGEFCDFILKCKERLCSRAQLEICQQTHKMMQNFSKNTSNLSDKNIEILSGCCTIQGDAYTKGMMLGGCAESDSCFFGCGKAFTRKV